LFVLVKELISKFDKFDISHINREENSEADELAKQATGFLI
jgi:ribonuclease HI